MKAIKFGLRERKYISGAELYVRAFQICSLLPLAYIIVASNYPKVIPERGPLSYLFELGISLLPRWEALGLSSLYRLGKSELQVFFAIVIGALAFGLLMGKLLTDEATSRLTRKVLVLLIVLDLVMRLLPFRWNTLYGMPMAVISFVFRAACLVLILLDFRAERKGKRE